MKKILATITAGVIALGLSAQSQAVVYENTPLALVTQDAPSEQTTFSVVMWGSGSEIIACTSTSSDNRTYMGIAAGALRGWLLLRMTCDGAGKITQLQIL